MKSYRKVIYVAALLLIVAPLHAAFALDLKSARAQKLVGEQLDGYVAVIAESDAATQLVEDINARRKEAYQRIATEKKQPVDAVAALSAEQIIERLNTGMLHQAKDGSWVQK